MPKPRSQLVDLGAATHYHCINRCVRRSFLFGDDPCTRKNFDHRKRWIAKRLAELSAIFAVDICAYGLMGNHFHVILRVDRERALAWDDSAVAARYQRLFAHTVKAAREIPEDLWAVKVSCWRRRLYDLSWFMRCLNEYIARRANREDGCKGRFWEGRFRSQALLDEGALLTCMSYVDLNPIRAGIATTLEDSELTSVQERLSAAAGKPGSTPCGLVPFSDQVAAPSAVEPIPMAFGDYVEVLRWTAAAMGKEPASPLPERVGSELERLGLDSSGFVASVCNFARSFFTMVGHVQRIDTESRRRGYRRRPGLPAARRLYRTSAA